MQQPSSRTMMLLPAALVLLLVWCCCCLFDPLRCVCCVCGPSWVTELTFLHPFCVGHVFWTLLTSSGRLCALDRHLSIVFLWPLLHTGQCARMPHPNKPFVMARTIWSAGACLLFLTGALAPLSTRCRICVVLPYMLFLRLLLSCWCGVLRLSLTACVLSL